MLKYSFFIYLLLWVYLPISAQSYFNSQYASVWSRSGEYTLEVAEAMPEENYNFKPEGGSMTFKEQLVHITQNLYFLSMKINNDHPELIKKEGSLNKEEIIENLKKSIEHVAQLIQIADDYLLNEKLNFSGENMTKENIFYLMRDHMAHHRGQIILHLRMNGIQAPAYRGW